MTAPIPLSAAQRRLWTLAQLRPGDPFFNHPFAVDLDGPLDVEALRGAMSELVRRHVALRMRIRQVDGEAVQVPAPAGPLTLDPVESSARSLDARSEAFAQRPFDVDGGELIRYRLVRVDERTHRLDVNLHHIVFDGRSRDLFVAELARVYGALVRGEPPESAPVADYGAVLLARAEQDAQDAQDNLRYWTERLAGGPEVTELPTRGPRPAVTDHRGARAVRMIPAEVVEPLRSLARSRRATVYLVLKAACDVLLSRYGTTKVHTGIALSGRDTADAAGVLGYLARPVVLSADLADDPSFVDLLARVRDDMLDAHDHPDLPFEAVLAAVGGQREVSYHPLYQVMFDYSVPGPPVTAAAVTFRVVEPRLATTKVDLSIGLVETGDGLRGEIDYRTDLFDPATVDGLLAGLEEVLRRVGADPRARVSRLLALDADAVAATETSPEPVEPCLHRQFEQQALATPDAVAVEVGRRGWTYRVLDAAADRLAGRLRDLGVPGEALVGVCTPRPPELPAALLGVLKAGAVAVPLDSSLPAFQVRAVAEDLGVDVVVADPVSAALFDRTRTEVLELGDGWDAGAAERVTAEVTPAGGAFVLHTGSAEEPRAVLVEHRNMANTLRWTRTELPSGTFAAVAPHSPPCSVGALVELFGALTSGGVLTLGGPSAPTVLCATPLTLADLVDSGLPVGVRTVLAHGAGLYPALTRRLRAAGAVRVVDLYAAAEAGGFALSDGRPVGAARAYVLDQQRRLMAPGVIGELYLAGAAAGRGYTDPTGTGFVDDLPGDGSGRRGYATGDLARYEQDGRITVIGRRDQQLRRRGSRVEPRDVEAALLEHDGVRAAAAVVAPDLVAAVVAREGATVAEPDLAAHLAQRLPTYLRPVRVAVLPSLPLLPGGQPDRERLAGMIAEAPSPDGSGAAAASNGVEAAIARAWATVLGHEVGVADNFFDIGGNSVLLLRLRAALCAALDTDIAVVDLFRYTTVRAQATHLAAAPDQRAEPPAAPNGAAARGSARKSAVAHRGRARRHG